MMSKQNLLLSANSLTEQDFFFFLQDLLDLKGGLAILAKNLFIKYFPYLN